MVSFGEEILISIGGVDYTTSIESYDESGGENSYEMLRTFGDKYQQILTGKSEYEISFDMKMESTTLNTLFTSATPVAIVINGGANSGTGTFSAITGTFAIGDKITGATSGATAYISNIVTTTLTLTEINGVFQNGETIVETSPGTESTGSLTSVISLTRDYTITYNNMLPKSLNIKNEIEGITIGTLSYIVSPKDSSGTDNRVIT